MLITMTLRTRITLLTLGLIAVSLVVIGASIFALLRGYLTNSLRTELEDASSQVVRLLNNSSQAFINPFEVLPPSLYAQLDLAIGTLNAKTLSDSGVENVRTSPILGVNRLVLREQDYVKLLETGQVIGQAELKRDQGGPLVLQVNARLLQLNSAFGRLVFVLYVGKPLEPITLTVREVMRIYILTSVVVLLLGIWLAYRLVQRTLQPLEWVAKRAEEVSERPSRLPELDGRNEVSALVRALNRMLSRLDEAWQTQTRFLADASHELRTPVTALLGHVGYLLRRTTLSEQQRESLETIQREGERMKKLIGDLLDLSKTGGTWRVDVSPVHLHTLLSEIADEYERSFALPTHQTGLGEIVLDVDEDLWVLGDADRLHQVFANLVSNAQKAQARRIRLVAHDLQERVVIRVEDDGEGIPTEHIPHLFERFYRVDRSRDRERGGSGLGLAIVKAILEAHNGTVWVESEPGKGSVFSVSLKRATAPQPLLD